jgi:predicted dehydrogenase
MGDALRIAEVDPARHADAGAFRFPPDRIAVDLDAFWNDVDAVDIVTGTDSHFALCRRALQDGKDVFVEKPMTLTSAEAETLARLVDTTKQVLQVGYYYRYHPASQWLKGRIDAGELGELRYLSGDFKGFKRARNDVGVMHTDGIHFLDLFNWLAGQEPVDMFAITRDHFGRGLEDLAIALWQYPGGAVGRVEAGYVQPGRWKDKVVAGAATTKEIVVVGSQKTAAIDFEVESAFLYDVHHELRNGTWTAVQQQTMSPMLPPAGPVDQIKLELADFLDSIRTRRPPGAAAHASGVVLARAIEAIYASSRTGTRVALGTPQASGR